MARNKDEAIKQKRSSFGGVHRIRISDLVIAVIILLLSLTCILPFIHVMAKSISSNTAVMSKLVFLWPVGWDATAYMNIFKDGQLTYSMVYTIIITVLFTVIGMVVTTFAAFPLSRRHLRGRSVFSFLIMFTMYFSAGLIPEYLLYRSLHISNTPWVLILPLAFSPYNMLIMKSFLQSTIPESLYEAAFLDGASNFTILGKIVLPLSKPIIATLSLFYAVGRWNAYADAKYYVTKRAYQPIQYLLANMIQTSGEVVSLSEGSAASTTPEVLQAAAIMFATIPIILVYPFVQKYFVKGVMIGAVKG